MRPHVVAALLIAAFDVLFERNTWTGRRPQTQEDVAAVIDPVIAFLR